MFQIKHETLIVGAQQEAEVLAQVARTPHDRCDRFIELFVRARRPLVQRSLELVERPCEHQAFFGALKAQATL